MKRAIFCMLVVPVLFFAGSFTGPWEQTAAADSGRRGREGAVLRGSRGGDVTVTRSREVVARRGDYGRRGDYARHSYVRHGGHRHSHGGHFSTSIWLGPSWGWSAWDPFYYPAYPYYRYPYYAPQTTVIVPQEPQEYIMKEQEQEETGYWYYCKDANGYYPYVQRCPGGWMKVVPREPPDEDEE